MIMSEQALSSTRSLSLEEMYIPTMVRAMVHVYDGDEHKRRFPLAMIPFSQIVARRNNIGREYDEGKTSVVRRGYREYTLSVM